MEIFIFIQIQDGDDKLQIKVQILCNESTTKKVKKLTSQTNLCSQHLKDPPQPLTQSHLSLSFNHLRLPITAPNNTQKTVTFGVNALITARLSRRASQHRQKPRRTRPINRAARYIGH